MINEVESSLIIAECGWTAYKGESDLHSLFFCINLSYENNIL